MNIADELTKKAGPLPVWAWLGIGGGVLLLLLGHGGGGGATGSSPAPDPNADGLDTSGLGGGALDLGAIAPVAPISSIGGDAGGFEDPIATPATAAPAPIGGVSPDSPAAIITPAPLALGVSLNADGSINLGGPLAGDIAADPATVAALSDSSYAGPLQAMQTPNGMLFSTSPLIPRPGRAVADIGGDAGFGTTPALSAFAYDNADATHVLVQPADSPAGAIAFATTPQTSQPNGNTVVQVSSIANAPADTHPTLPTQYVEGSIVPAGTAQVA